MDVTKAELDMADALLDAVHLQAAGGVMGAGMRAIPAIKHDPIMSCAVLMQWLAYVVHQYAAATGQTPDSAFDELLSKPNRHA